LIKAVWRDVFVTSDSLTQCVREVRAALGDNKHCIIKTVPRRGYVFAAPVTGPESECRAQHVPSTTSRLSIAVLPFLNLSNDPDQEYLADGLTDSLTTDLSHIPGSFVIARSSAFTYKRKAVEAQQIGRDLGVRYLLEGSVQRCVDRIRVNAQLVDAQTGAELWAERYDRDIADALAIQDDITCRIALSLDVVLHEVESQRASRERPANPDASDLVMRAWAIWNRKVTPANIAQACQLFEEALRIDPECAAALVGFARMNIAEVLSHSAIDRDRNIQVAEGAITRALELDQRNALAHLTRGLVLRAQGKLEASLAAFRKAIDLNHNEVRAYVAIGDAENALGRAGEAIDALQHALRLDPRDHRINIFAMLGWSHLLLGRDDEAIDWFLQSIHHNPTARRSHLWLACAYALIGKDDDAYASLKTFNRLMPEYTISKNTAIDASDNPVFVRQRERLYAALRRIGVPD
jgi:TolB-like protein/Tfp pilus assembly protein PilF